MVDLMLLLLHHRVCTGLTFCMVGNFSRLSSADFFQNYPFQKFLSDCQSSFDPDEAPCFVGPDLGPN